MTCIEAKGRVFLNASSDIHRPRFGVLNERAVPFGSRDNDRLKTLGMEVQHPLMKCITWEYTE